MDNNNVLPALALLAGLLCYYTIHAMVTTKPKLPHPLLTKRLLEEIFYQQDKSYFTGLPRDITKNYIFPMTLSSIAKDRDAHTRRKDKIRGATRWNAEELLNSLNSPTVSREEKNRRCIEYKQRWTHLDQELTPYYFSLLISTILAENLTAAEILLTHGSAVNHKSNIFYTPLIIAATNNDPVAVQFLINYKAEVDLMLYDNTTALWKAAEMGFSEIVSILLSAKADPNARHIGSKQTALSKAASKNHVEVVRLLLNAKADPAIPDLVGSTPLVIASEKGHYEVVSLLLSHNNDPNPSNQAILH